MEGGEAMAEAKTREIRITIPEELFCLFVPEKSVEHLFKAKKEILLSLRSLIDAKIESLEKKEEKRSKPKQKIKVE